MVGWLAGHVTRKKTATNLQRFDFPEWKKEYPSGNRLNDIHLEQVIKVIFDVRPHRRHRRLNRIRQMATTCPHGRAHWRHLANTIQLVLPSAPRVHNPNGKSIGSAVSAQLTAESQYTVQWAPLSPKIAPSYGDLDPI